MLAPSRSEDTDHSAIGQRHQAKLFLGRPIAASIPSWRIRRWAMTTKLAAAMSPMSNSARSPTRGPRALR